MKKVIILCGVPGCGKSTYARSIPYAVVCSADDFFMKDGVYTFNPSLLGQAHAKCFGDFLTCIGKECPCIIVDNTNIQRWERQNYETVALMCQYDVEYKYWLLKTEKEIQCCLKRNTHEVPESVVRSMLDRFQQPFGSRMLIEC